VRITPQTRARLVEAAAASGRSITQEAEFRLDASFAETAYPPEIGALAELLARIMAEVGATVTGANRLSGYGRTDWVEDGFAFDQAVKAALHVLRLSRPTGSRAPHGIFPTLDGPDLPTLSRQIGKRVADGILEVMRGRERDRSALWSSRIREKLGAIGDRLDKHPSPDGFFFLRPAQSMESPRRPHNHRRPYPPALAGLMGNQIPGR
jgi:hypothetical protein